MHQYQQIDNDLLATLEYKHKWLVTPLYNATNYMMSTPFFTWLDNIKSPQELTPVVLQLYYHSLTLPRVLGLMLGLSQYGNRAMMPFFARHIDGESNHYELLATWMQKYEIIRNLDELENVIVLPETNACINLGYQLAIEQDNEKWLVAINCGIERCSNYFFGKVTPKMHELGAGDIYFDIHVEADEHHSIWGLQYLEEQVASSRRAMKLIATMLEAVSLWISMLHSWIGISLHPYFSLSGDLIRS